MKYRKPTHAEQKLVPPGPFAFGMLAVWFGATLLLGAGTALAQSSETSEFGQTQTVPLAAEELEELVGPIALYPDDLVGIVLPASTYPLQIVQAARFLEDLEDDPNLEPDPEWDNSIVALLNYPEALMLLNDDLDWTWSLGQAVLNQQSEVIDAIQDFRERAYVAGNLETDDRQIVTEDDGVIEIAPADPEVIYVPYYEPAHVVVAQPRRVYFYYDYGYPLYYYPYPIGYRFRTGFFWGVTSAFSIGWHTHYVHVHHHSHYGHPYYRYPYHTPYYARRGVNINININNVGHVWQPRNYRAARPHYRTRSTRVVRSTQVYTNDLRRARQQRSLGGGSVDPRSFTSPRRQYSAGRTTANISRQRPNTGRSFSSTRTGIDSRSSARNQRDRNRTVATVQTQTRSNPARLAVENSRRNMGAVAGRPSDRNVSRNNDRDTRRVPTAAGTKSRSTAPARSSRGAAPTVNRAANARTPTFAAPARRQAANASARSRTQTGNMAHSIALPSSNRSANRPANARTRTFAAPSARQTTSQPRAQARMQSGNNRPQARANRSARRSSTAQVQSGRRARVD